MMLHILGYFQKLFESSFNHAVAETIKALVFSCKMYNWSEMTLYFDLLVRFSLHSNQYQTIFKLQ